MASLSDLSLLTTQAYLNGEWVTKPHSFAVSNPFSSEVIAEVSDCDEHDAASAVACEMDACLLHMPFNGKLVNAPFRAKCIPEVERCDELHPPRSASVQRQGTIFSGLTPTHPTSP